jgi:hypothetical protein
MPNGHGGIPRFGSVVLLGGALVLLYFLHLTKGWEWCSVAGYVMAMAFGWRLAFHLCLWDATEYDGAYTKAEEMARARRRFRIAAACCSLVAVGVWFGLVSLR